MKKAGKALIWAAGIYAVVVVGSGLLIQALLTPGRIGGVVKTLTAGLPVQVSAGEGSFDLLPWLRFQPVVRIRRISVANPPGYSKDPMLTVGEASAQVSLFSLLGTTVQVPRLELREAALNVESGGGGRSNLAALLASLDKAEEAPPGDAGGKAQGRGIAIGSIALERGTVRYREQGSDTGLTVRDIHVVVSGFGPGRPAEFLLEAGLFGGKASRLSFQGQAGPFGKDSISSQGVLDVKLSPAEIPRAMRLEYAGDFLADPPPAARVTLKAEVKGDLMTSLNGAGEVQFADFAVGCSMDTRLPLNGAAPFRITARRPLSMPEAEIAIQRASLQLGQGRWGGSLSIHYSGQSVRGESRGSIEGVRVEELTRAFTTAKDPVFGRAEIPEYELRFAGKNAAELRNSLAGSGSIRLEEGRVALFDLLGTIEGKINKVLGGEEGKPGATNFLKFAAKFEIGNGRIDFPEIALQDSSASVMGQGFVGFDHALSFDLVTDAAGGLASRLGGKFGSASLTNLRIPVRVRGTLESPKVYPDVGGMAKTAAVEKARGLLDSFLKKRQSGAQETK